MLLYSIVLDLEPDEMIGHELRIQQKNINVSRLKCQSTQQGLVGLRVLRYSEECELPNEFLYTFASQLPMFSEGQ